MMIRGKRGGEMTVDELITIGLVVAAVILIAGALIFIFWDRLSQFIGLKPVILRGR